MSADERREKLLEAALTVMTRDGVAAGSTRAIVGEAGMQVSTFHYCFRSRNELLRELIVRLSATERQAAFAGMEPAPTLRETLQGAVEGYLNHLLTNPEQELVLFELNHHALRTPELHDLAEEQYRGYYKTTEEILSLAAELTGSRWTVDLSTVARLVVTATDGVTTTWLADRDTEATRQVMERFLDTVVDLAEPIDAKSS